MTKSKSTTIRDYDPTLVQDNLKKTPEERLIAHERARVLAEELAKQQWIDLPISST
ncbi:MAG: hypothetical protein R3A45_04335 [Bdellovibrionota bacterium]